MVVTSSWRLLRGPPTRDSMSHDPKVSVQFKKHKQICVGDRIPVYSCLLERFVRSMRSALNNNRPTNVKLNASNFLRQSADRMQMVFRYSPLLNSHPRTHTKSWRNMKLYGRQKSMNLMCCERTKNTHIVFYFFLFFSSISIHLIIHATWAYTLQWNHRGNWTYYCLCMRRHQSKHRRMPDMRPWALDLLLSATAIHTLHWTLWSVKKKKRMHDHASQPCIDFNIKKLARASNDSTN